MYVNFVSSSHALSAGATAGCGSVAQKRFSFPTPSAHRKKVLKKPLFS
jgi:hypothetical protein